LPIALAGSGSERSIARLEELDKHLVSIPRYASPHKMPALAASTIETTAGRHRCKKSRCG
jgi:hypothetical protein